MSWLGLLDAIDYLAELGWRVDLDPTARAFELVLVPSAQSGDPTPVPLDVAGRALLDVYRGSLVWVARGRYTGHVPATCSACGFVSMLPRRLVPGVPRSGAPRGLGSARWPRCPLASQCKGRRVVREQDLLDVPRSPRPWPPR